MDLGLKGKNTIVTGASKGVGRGIVKALLVEGAHVFAVGRDQGDLDSLKKEMAELKTGAEIESYVQDLQDIDAASKIADAFGKKFGSLYLLVNNAGASQPAQWDESEDAWQKGMTLGFDRPRQLAQACIPLMGKDGRIISITGTVEGKDLNIAGVAKAALTSWTKGMAGALASKNITVNCIAPGLIDSAQIRRIFPGENAAQFAQANIPMGKFGVPADIANLVLFLASEQASYITGVAYSVDGGMRPSIF